MDFRGDYRLTINGAFHATPRSIEVTNPATGENLAFAPNAGREELDAAVEAAAAAFAGWRATPIEERQKALKSAGKRLAQNADALGTLFTAEQGRPLPAAKEEILGAAYWFLQLSKQSLPVEVTEDNETRRVELHHEPLGVVGALVPWNFPVLLAVWKIAPALLTGNTIVVKPSPFTPLTTLKVGELIQSCFPPGVLNVISGDDALGPLMTSHPGIAKISFTGSTATGKRVMAAAAADLKRITLELGGNDAAIILPDVDVDAIAPTLFHGAFYNTAQVCVATKRLYIHADIYDRVRDKLHEIAKAAKVGDGAEQGTDYGPLQNRPQYERVKAMLEEASAAGLTLLQGGPVPEQGYFVPLTLVDNPPENARVVREEAFGPILPLLKYSDLDDVISRANDSEYGLAGAVWATDIEAAVQVAHRLDTGTVWINQNLQSTPTTPLAGHKQSGVGAENGRAGLEDFTYIKSVYIPKSARAVA